MDLSVLVYNVEYGGGPDTDRVIRKLDADVVGVLELRAPARDRAPDGLPVLQHLAPGAFEVPDLEPSGGEGLYAMLEVEPGYGVPFFNEHLDYERWGPRALVNGASVDTMSSRARTAVRTSAMERPFDAMSALVEPGYPVVPDRRPHEPSSLDYNRGGRRHAQGDHRAGAVAGQRAHARPRLPRQLPRCPSRPRGRAGTTHRSGERIDYVYAAGPSKTVDSEVVARARRRGRRHRVRCWTSDHNAVLSNFEVTPLELPTMVAVNARLADVGDELTVTHNTPGSDDNETAVLAEGGDPADPVDTLAAPAGERGTRRKLDTAGWEPGGYDVVLTDADGRAAGPRSVLSPRPACQAAARHRPERLRAR